MADSADGKRLAWGDLKGTVRMHSFDEKTTRTVLNLSHVDITAGRTVEDIAFDERGRLLWVDASNGIYRYDLAEGADSEVTRIAVALKVRRRDKIT
jgi:hypothetical protein